MSTVYNDPIMLDSTGQDIVTKLDSIAGLMGDGVIDDTSTAADKTWSASKINTQLGTKANANLVPSGASTSNKLATASDVQDVYEANGVLGAKNLLYIHIDNLKLYNTSGTWVDNKYTLNNVEFDISVNAVGFVTSIAVKSTGATANTDLRLYRESGSIAWFKTLPKGKYILNGVQGGSTSTYYLQINKQNASGNEIEGCKCTDGDANLDTSESLDGYINYWFQVNNGIVVDTVIYPMLRLATDTDPTYQPFAMTNKELTENTQELKYRVGILSTPVPAYVSRCTPPRFKDITDDWFNGSLRAEIAAGNFKNVVSGDYIKDGNTMIWVANPDGMYNKGDQTGSAYQSQAYRQHHLEVFIKYMGSTSLWLGKGDANGSWQVSANDKGRCPWNAATDVDPTSTTALGSNNTNITRTYDGNNVSGYMGSFIRERMDTVILPYLQSLFGSDNVLKFRNLNGNVVTTDKPSGGQSNWNGLTTGWSWYDRYLDLPSEIEVFGSRIFGSAYDQGLQCEQLPIFKNAQINDVVGRLDFWTKTVASSGVAAGRTDVGSADGTGASRARWACPLACIK